MYPLFCRVVRLSFYLIVYLSGYLVVWLLYLFDYLVIWLSGVLQFARRIV